MTNQQTLAGMIGDVADAIRAKDGSQNTMTLAQMPTRIAAIPSGGGTDQSVGMIEGTATSYSSNDVTTVRGYGFYNLQSIQSVSLPNATIIGASAFSNCPFLTSVNLPSAQRIGSNIFEFNTRITSISLPSATRLERQAFSGNSALATIDIPSVTTMDLGACASTAIASIELPSVTSIGNTVFSGCSNLMVVDLCSPNRTTIPTLSNVKAFQNTPISSGNGTIYINDDLVDALKAGTNWDTFASQIKGESQKPSA